MAQSLFKPFRFDRLHNASSLPLRFVLIVPFVIEIVAVVGLTGYLSWRNGQESVHQIAATLREEINTRIVQYLDRFLVTPTLINRLNTEAVQLGELDLDNSAQLERHLFTQLQQFDTVSHVMVGTERGVLRVAKRYPHLSAIAVNETAPMEASVYDLDRRGNLDQKRQTVQPFNLHDRPWYRAAAIANRPVRVPIFQLAIDLDYSLNASQPVYDQAGHLRGVFSAASDLSQLRQFMTSLAIGQTGRAFVIERNGLLVGTSTPQPSSQHRRVNAVDSEDRVIRAASRHLKAQFGNSQIETTQRLTFFIDDDRQFLQIQPYRDSLGLDWLIVVVVPEADFMGEIDRNTRTTLWLCLVALAAAIGLGLLIAHWIARPIVRLSRASRAMALGEWKHPVQISSRITELEVLARSFNQMTSHLQQSLEQDSCQCSDSHPPLKALPVHFYLDSEQRYRFVSQRYADRLGRTPEQLYGQPIQSVLTHADYCRLQPHLEAALTGNTATCCMGLDCLELMLPDVEAAQVKGCYTLLLG